MTRGDRLWLLALVLGAVAFTHVRLAGPWQLALTVVWVLVFTVTALYPPRTPAQSGWSAPQDLVRAQLEAYATAGFTEDQAKALMQEALRTAIKTQGGWRP